MLSLERGAKAAILDFTLCEPFTWWSCNMLSLEHVAKAAILDFTLCKP